ncbi:hypothetical protein C7460_11796 [Marinoscillum furvescens DSM 4134]|uniref:Uncharacterized protein n=2 Tax=Marinoscillum furvescens TaxID=1026 RepID=A0A3D9KZR4_MARFU|nr:hypothetical protein C7460_11796 [Marinoscillum furvescens DSM 4134]
MLTGLALFFTFLGTAQESSSKLKVNIDCRGCNDSYIRQNTLFLDHVRDQNLADVYLLVNTSGNPSSVIYNLEYTGKGQFEGINNTFDVDFSRTLTSNELRDKLLKAVINGFIPYMMHTNMADQLIVEVLQSEEANSTTVDDPWNNWIFEIYGNFNMRDQDTRNELNTRMGAEGDKVTENWRVRLDAHFNRNILKIDENDEEFTSIRDWKYTAASVVKSLGDHWSAGIFSSISSNTVDNIQVKTNISPAVEYSFFDYREVLTKEVTLAYKVGYNHQKYLKTTIYDVNEDRYPSQSFSLNVRFRKNWGNLYSGVSASNFLNDFSKNRLSMNNSAAVRVFKGFSVRVNASFDMIRDQINLEQGDASLEDIILQQRAIATNYRLSVGAGVSYTFGSIYNNILNTRL